MGEVSIRSERQLSDLLGRWKKQLLAHTYSDFISLSIKLGAHPPHELLLASYKAETLEEIQLLNKHDSGFSKALSNQMDDVADAILARKGASFAGDLYKPFQEIGIELPSQISNQALQDVIAILKLNGPIKASIINAIEDSSFPYSTLGAFEQARPESLRCLRSLLHEELKVIHLIDESIQNLLSQEPLLRTSDQKECDVISRATLRDLNLKIDEALEVLTDREHKILRMRFGIGMNQQFTLEEVGKQFGVTRERIRQIEAKALRKLRHPSRINNIKSLCVQLREEIFQKLSNADGIVGDESHKYYMKEVDPRLVLGLVISEGTMNKWLDKYFPKLGSGWASLNFSQIGLLAAEQKIKAHMKNALFPVPLSSLKALGDLGVFKTVLALSNVANQLDGYLCKRGPIYERARRAIRLHRVAHQFFPSQLYEAQKILKIYNEIYPNSATNLRLIEMDMGKYSHLFVRIYEHLWCSLGDWEIEALAPTVVDEHCEIEDFLVEDEPQERETEDSELSSITNTLVKILRDKGPMGFVDLRQAMRETLGPDFPDGSMVLVNMRDDFVRLAPGVYALSGFVVDEEIPAAALTEFHCRIYAIARKGGEIDGYYPLWTRKYEMELCKWAKESVDHRLFESLLDVIEPTSWPCSYEESFEWSTEKHDLAHYQLYRDPKPNLVKPEVCPVEFLSILKYLMGNGSVSWMTINRCMNERLDSMCAVWMLGLLASVKAVVVPEHWQLPHQAGENLVSILSQLENELVTSGTLDWRKGTAKDTLDLACDDNDFKRNASINAIFRVLAESYSQKFGSNLNEGIEKSFDEFLEKHEVEKEQNELDILFESL